MTVKTAVCYKFHCVASLSGLLFQQQVATSCLRPYPLARSVLSLTTLWQLGRAMATTAQGPYKSMPCWKSLQANVCPNRIRLASPSVPTAMSMHLQLRSCRNAQSRNGDTRDRQSQTWGTDVQKMMTWQLHQQYKQEWCLIARIIHARASHNLSKFLVKRSKPRIALDHFRTQKSWLL